VLCVPAGTFTALHFKENWFMTIYNHPLLGTYTSEPFESERWFAPDVGEVKHIWTDVGTNPGPRQLELVASNLVNDKGLKNSGLPQATCPVGGSGNVSADPAMGRSIAQETDYQGAGAQPLLFKRQYLSANSLGTSGLGPQWRHTYSRSIQILNAAGTRALAVRGDGRGIVFTRASTTSAWSAELQSLKDRLSSQTDANGLLTGWQYFSAAQDSTETYNDAGMLTAIKQRNGWNETLIYSDITTPPSTYLSGSSTPRAGLLIGIKNHFGRELKLVYDAQGRLAQLLPPGAVKDAGAGLVSSPIRYAYGEAASLGAGVADVGQLTSVTWQDGTVKRYHYEDPRFASHLSGITDEANTRIASLGYDSAGRLAGTQQANGSAPITLAYGSGVAANQTTVTDTSAAGGSTTSRVYTFAALQGVLAPTAVTAPCPLCSSTQQATVFGTTGGAKDQPIKTVAHDGTVTFTAYDAKGRETEKAAFASSYAGSSTRPALNLASSVISTQWHATYNLPTRRAEPGRITAYTYASANATTGMGAGNLTGQSETTTTDATGGSKFTAVQAANTPIKSTGWSYSSTSSLPTTIVERETAFGATTATETGRWTYAYDVAGNTTQSKDVFVTPNTLNKVTAYNAAGRPTSITSETGSLVTTAYDARGRVAELKWGTNYGVKYEYAAHGGLKKAVATDGGLLEVTYSSTNTVIKIVESGQTVYDIKTSALTTNTISSLNSKAAVNAVATASSIAIPIPDWGTPGGASEIGGRALGACTDFIKGALWFALLTTPSSTSACDTIEKNDACKKEQDKDCKKAIKDAQSAYHDLITKRIPQYESGGTRGQDPGHLQAIIQKQNALKDAIRRIRLYCKPLPPELPEWERAANLTV
jgi:YD repeat-containing protein